jgi:hypothetical protein
MQSDWSRDGRSSFVFVVLELIVDEESRLAAEDVHIHRTPLYYNLNGRAGSGPKAGYKHHPRSIEKMRLAQLGKKKTDAHRQAISIARKGMKFSAEHRAAIGRGLLGGKRTEETRQLMSVSATVAHARRRACK